MRDAVYIGSYKDYGQSQSMLHMHFFVAPFEYNGRTYRDIYSAKETRNADDTYSSKLYLQKVDVLPQNNERQKLKTKSGVSAETPETGNNYISSAVDTSIPNPNADVNTISVEDLLAGYNLNQLKEWPLAKLYAAYPITLNGSPLLTRLTDNELAVHNFVAAVKHNGVLYRVEYNVK